MFIDSFSGSLDDIPVKRQKDARYVLECLKRNPVFSAFDINTSSLAKTVDKLHVEGYMTYRRDTQYPWNKVEITEKGSHFLSSQQ
jgi:predicted transcriptional regulator